MDRYWLLVTIPLINQTLVDTASATIPYLDGSTMAFSLPTDDDFDAMKPGQLTHQLKQVVSKPGHVNKLYYWFVHLKVNCCYKTALIGWHPIKIVCKAICNPAMKHIQKWVVEDSMLDEKLSSLYWQSSSQFFLS